jgi:hypothetical protein
MLFKKILFLLFYSIVLCFAGLAQLPIRGIVVDGKTNQPIEGAVVTLLHNNATVITDATGGFIYREKQTIGDTVRVSSIGYAEQIFALANLPQPVILPLTQQQSTLKDVTVSSRSGDQYKAISRADIAMRGVSNSQEVLRIIPGVVIGQHQGGGKAEQIFLRGFDCDHGTDFRLDVDGLPINMVSHAHGQGFADSHFIIPETIETVDFKKGPYTASKGDFATTGFVDFNTKKALANNTIKLEGGMFNTFRGLGMFNLLGSKARAKQQSWYVATEYRYADGYFDAPQHFNRFNLFTKFNGKISAHNYLSLSATAFWSKWNASGQIPERAVKNGLIGFYGAIDPFEGGLTSRTNINAQLITTLNNGGLVKNQVYLSNSQFDLHTNFTFYLVDTVNGDEIRQKEGRNMVGYNGSYSHTGYWGSTKVTTEAGINVRGDMTSNSELSHTLDRFITLNRIKLGNITQWNISPYISETFALNRHVSINAGLRLDQFYHAYNNKLPGDTTLPGVGVYKAAANTVSPKLNMYYHVNNNLQFYLTAGKGFHSNDTRSVVVEHGQQVLPGAYGADAGTVFKPNPNLIVNVALWYIYLAQEYVYSGDGGDVQFSGKTRRIGMDFSGRYQPLRNLYFDVDVNYAHGRSTSAPKGANYIPLAPIFTSAGGITYTAKNGLNGSLRYRYISNRPANEDYSLTATGYFITDAVVNYSTSKYEIGLVINNVLNTKWKETQFATVTRLKGEAQPVDEICFTPGTPFAAKLSLSVWF